MSTKKTGVEVIHISREDAIQAPTFQGDTMIWGCKDLPQTATLVTGAEKNIVAHSETGHHHIVTGGDVFSIPSDPLSLYVKATAHDVSFQHLRDWDTHNTLQFKGEIGDIYHIRNQREHTPEGWVKVSD